MGFFSLPFISNFSFWVQFSILTALLLVSYLHRATRIAVGTLVSGHILWKIALPILSFVIWSLKGIAWLGFYIFFLQHALHSAMQLLVWVVDDALPWFAGEVAKAQAARSDG